jgi:hypothetical protein
MPTLTNQTQKDLSYDFYLSSQPLLNYFDKIRNDGYYKAFDKSEKKIAALIYYSIYLLDKQTRAIPLLKTLFAIKKDVNEKTIAALHEMFSKTDFDADMEFLPIIDCAVYAEKYKKLQSKILNTFNQISPSQFAKIIVKHPIYGNLNASEMLLLITYLNYLLVDQIKLSPDFSI